MKEQSWQTKKRIEQEYSSNMMKLAQHFFSKAIEGVGSYDEQLEALRSASSQAKFKEWANTVARRMITGLHATSASTWREAASEGTQGRMIYKMLSSEMEGVTGSKVQELVRNNADLISSLPLDIAQLVTNFVQRQAASGMRYEEIGKLMKEKRLVHKLTASRITLIARTETSKATTALTKARSEDLGLDFYIWRTSKDQRVRNSHKHMEGVLVPWGEAPAPEALANVKSKLGHYHAGDAPNDRCYPEPVINLSSLRWPMKVYHNSRIQYMTRSVFEKTFGIERMAA